MLHVYFKREDDYDSVLTEDNYRIQPTFWFEFQGGASYIQGDVERAIISDIDKGEVPRLRKEIDTYGKLIYSKT